MLAGGGNNPPDTGYPINGYPMPPPQLRTDNPALGARMRLNARYSYHI